MFVLLSKVLEVLERLHLLTIFVLMLKLKRFILPQEQRLKLNRVGVLKRYLLQLLAILLEKLNYRLIMKH